MLIEVNSLKKETFRELSPKVQQLVNSGFGSGTYILTPCLVLVFIISKCSTPFCRVQEVPISPFISIQLQGNRAGKIPSDIFSQDSSQPNTAIYPHALEHLDDYKQT